MACPHLDIRDGPTRTPSGTWVPTEVSRARVGPPMALGPGFAVAFWGFVPFGLSVPWALVPLVRPWSMALGLSCYLLVAFFGVFSKPSYMELEALSRDSACKTEKKPAVGRQTKRIAQQLY